VRTAEGTINSFDDPSGPDDTVAESINRAGSITGNYLGAGDLLHGFVRIR
jgi:hypothetical protein